MRQLPDAVRCYEQALLARGDQTLKVLRNLETAQTHSHEKHSSSKG